PGRCPAVVGFGLVERKAGDLDVVDGEAAEVQVAVGHVLESKLDLLAGVRREIGGEVPPAGRGLPTGGTRDPVAEVLAVRIRRRRRLRLERRPMRAAVRRDRKSTRLNSSHVK